MMFNAKLVLMPVIAALASCASTAPRISDALAEVTGQNGRACVRTDEIRGYGARDNNTVNIDALRAYYVAIIGPGCIDLAVSAAAAFSSDSYELCGGRMDRIVVSGNSCTIRQMFEFADRNTAFEAYDAAEAWRERAIKGSD